MIILKKKVLNQKVEKMDDTAWQEKAWKPYRLD